MSSILSASSAARAWEGPMCVAEAGAPARDRGTPWSDPGAPRFGAVIDGRSDTEVLACLPSMPAYTGQSSSVARGPSPADAHPAARRAYAALSEHRAAGRTAEALVSLASLRELAPELSDRWDLIEGELLPAERRGCDAYERALASPHSAVAARARVGRVRCLIERGDRRAEAELRSLLARYPELPEALDLRMLDAAAREARGDLRGAIAVYRAIDLEHPDRPAAARARDAIARLAAAGQRIPAYSPMQLVERLERIVRSGAPDFARAEIERLSDMSLPRRELAEVTLLAARIARVEGRFEDAAALMQRARTTSGAVVDGDADVRAQADDLAAAAQARAQEEAQAELRRLMGRSRALRTVPTTRLFGYLRTAARAGLRAELDGALDEASSRSLPCGLRLEAGVLASGAADDDRVARMFEGCVNAPGSIGVASRYHRARALDRLGRRDEARAELAQVLEQDHTETRWYAMWSRQWLAGAHASAASSGAPGESGKGGERAAGAVAIAAADRAAPAPIAPAVELEDEELGAEVPMQASAAWSPLPREEIEVRLAALVATHGEGFPWFARALALTRLGDDDAATDELHEAYLAWHQARGRGTLRAGVEAVYRGATPPRVRTASNDVWRARRALGADEAASLADIVASLGDHGLAIRYGGRQRVAMRPRAYAELVERAARERGLDPNLLFAVMRVESVYNPRIVSYAGAIGLLQIMPRTGRLIARSMGREDSFGVDDLLDPRTNIEFAAWYLSSLIRRFDGRVPLAVAAYNGGPHNVRRWMREHAEQMPIDAFCERIPFDQTHRYVRRVLSHWAAYRAQQGLSMVTLDPTLPALEADPVAF